MTIAAHWTAIRAGWLAYRASLKMGDNGASYSALTLRGVPHITLLLGQGREAWRISQFAIDVQAVKDHR
jgi:hypothetical protein